MSNNDCLDRHNASTAIALVMSNTSAHFVATETSKAGQNEKRPRGVCQGQQIPQPTIGPHKVCIVVVAAVRSKATTTSGQIGEVEVEIMLDSGSSISLVQHDVLHRAKDIQRIQPRQLLRLVTTSGEHLPIVEHIQAPVKLGELELMHEFVVVDSLVAPVILGVDFLQGNGLVLDFTQTPVMVRHATAKPTMPPSQACAQVMPIYQDERRMQASACAITALDQPGEDMVDDCAVPNYTQPPSIELPDCQESSLSAVVAEHKDLFHTTPGHTGGPHHRQPCESFP